MSYSIGLEIDTGGPEPTDLGISWGCTRNAAPMWRRAGADLAACDGYLAGNCLPQLDSAIAHMKANPSAYEPMNPENEWGGYGSTVKALEELAAHFRRHPKATVRVSR